VRHCKRRIPEVEVATKEVQEERVRQLNEKEVVEGDYVLYWMQEAQRAEYNHALEYAVQRANELGQRLLVVFGLTDDYPEANLRHYAFLLEGLQNVKEELKERNIKFVVRRGSPDEVALNAGKSASLIVCDMSYLRLQKEWRENVAEGADCLVVQVETEVVVPSRARVEQAGTRGANPEAKNPRTPRRVPGRARTYRDREAVPEHEDDGLDLSDVGEILDDMNLDRKRGSYEPPSTGAVPKQRKRSSKTS
jgi:deoxyribodipyrimidine photo-lyase